MAHGGILPGSRGHRYEEVTGGSESRKVYGLVLRYFHLLRHEWDALSWCDQQMYLEELERQFAEENGEESDSPEQSEAERRRLANERFAQTGEHSLANEPVEQDFTGMDQLMKGARKRSASSK